FLLSPVLRPPRSTPFPYTTLFRSRQGLAVLEFAGQVARGFGPVQVVCMGLRSAALPGRRRGHIHLRHRGAESARAGLDAQGGLRSEEHTSELQSRENLVCRLLLDK